jgi:hypothetical protein
MGENTGIFKIKLPEGRLEMLAKFKTDFKPVEPATNCCRWSMDN